MTITELNQLDLKTAGQAFTQCCTAEAWVEKMLLAMPYDNIETLSVQANNNWQGLSEADYLQAFEGHPKIGDVSSLREKYRATEQLASGEQSGVNNATEHSLIELKQLNDDYEEKFGFIFIVCATGKTAQQMLSILALRIVNDRTTELINAAEEQRKILQIRIEKMLTDSVNNTPQLNQKKEAKS